MTTRRSERLTTRVLLVCAALAAVHVLLHLLTVPLLTVLAPLSPPAYGFVAGIHSVMPFLARRLTGVPGSAVITSAVAAVFVATTSPSGVIVTIPLLVAGAVIDFTMWAGRGNRGGTYYVAAVLAGTALFALSLAVFSPEHLTWLLLCGTWVARVVGELVAAALSAALALALRRAGVGRALRA